MDSCSGAWDLVSHSCPGPDMGLPVRALVLLLHLKLAWGHLADLDLLLDAWGPRVLHLHLDLHRQRWAEGSAIKSAFSTGSVHD